MVPAESRHGTPDVHIQIVDQVRTQFLQHDCNRENLKKRDLNIHLIDTCFWLYVLNSYKTVPSIPIRYES